MKKAVIILAAGSSNRFSAPIPKVFTRLGKKPAIVHSVSKFLKAVPEASITIVLQKEQYKNWEKLREKYFSEKSFKVVKGGNSRMESVFRALKKIKGNKLVAIHDGARPAVSKKLIKKAFAVAGKYGSAVPVITVSDSLLKIKSKKIKRLKRSDYFRVQTPQCFDLKSLKRAYKFESVNDTKDDSEIWIRNYGRIKLIDGERGNLKLTFAEDIPALKGIIKG